MDFEEAGAAQSKLVMRESPGSNLIEVELSGKLGPKDYHQLFPDLERLIRQHGAIRLLIVLRDFHGWRLAAMWPDVNFDFRMLTHFERIALVGEKRWQEWLSHLANPFTTGEVRFFYDAPAARLWLAGNESPAEAVA
jgi:hypothetical protein